ncbi:MAG: TonB-dependent receptor, partial [Bacteroidota bacterium]
ITREDGTEAFFISPAEFDLPFHFWRTLNDQQYAGKVDVTIPLGGSSANKLQVGGFYSDKTRAFRDNVYQVQLGYSERYNGDPDLFFDNNNVGIIDFDENTERRLIGLYPINFLKSTRENSYDGSETISAAYAMTVYDWDVIKIIAGARAEKTDIFVASQDTTLETGAIDQLDFLPSANVIVKLTDNMNIRVTGTQTIARPNMRELAPFVSFDFGGDFRIQGNPNLQRTLVQNADLRWEMFPKPGEIIAASVYYKNFKNPIVTAFVPEAANPLIRYINVDRAQVYGLELELRKNLAFIGPAFENFKFSTNLSLIQSVVDISQAEQDIIADFNPEKGTTRPFQGQSPYLINASLNYVDVEKGWDAIVSFNVFGERLSNISEGRTPDIYEQPRPQLDFSVSKSLTENFGIRLRANNILNPATRTLMRFNGEEYNIQEFNRGASFGISLSYKI